jgi:hypothetical protein
MGDSPNSFLGEYGLPPIHDANGFQTHFGHGDVHFSQTHGIHDYGSTAPIQRDLNLLMPDGKLFKKLVAEDAPPRYLPFQTKLTSFKH